MRIILIIVIFIFSLQSLTKADKVTDFVIEGIRVGDSLLDFYSQEQINRFFIVEYPSSKKFIGWETDRSINFEEYTAMTFHVKSDDNTMKIFSIKGMLNYPNKIESCLNKKKEIVEQIKGNVSYQDFYSYEDNFGNKMGESKAYIADFDLSDGGGIRVWCSVWDKRHEVSKNWIDTLNVGASSKPFFDFLSNEAYK